MRPALLLVAGAAAARADNATAPAAGAWDPSAAKEMMYAAYSSYCKDKKLQDFDCFWCKKAATRWNIVTIAEDKKKNAKGYVAYAPGKVMVAFRGTQALSLKNWLEDIQCGDLFACIPKPYTANGAPAGAMVHPGFHATYLAVQQQILTAVRQAVQLCGGSPVPPAPSPSGRCVCRGGVCSPDPTGAPCATCAAACGGGVGAGNVTAQCEVLVTGHSLGAAMAGHAALDLKVALGLDPKVTTFGLPRLGNPTFAEYWDSTIQTDAAHTHWRVVNGYDCVPHLPTVKMGKKYGGYQHVSHEVWENPGGSTQFTLCPAPTYKCADNKGVPAIGCPAHLTYFGEQLLLSSGAIQCEP